MKKLVATFGLAAAMLSTPLAIQAQTLQEKIDDAVGEIAAAYGVDAANSLFNAVVAVSNDNAPVRFNQYASQTSWYINGVLTHNITYEEAIDSIASQITDDFDGYWYQHNAYFAADGTFVPATSYRIKIQNKDGTYFNQDWIYASSINSLIVNLAEESFQEGFTDGFENGYNEGYKEGYADGFIDGYKVGYTVGVNEL